MYSLKRRSLVLAGASIRESNALVLAVLYFLFSLYIYPKYTSGDQTYYRNFYDAASTLGLRDSFLYYQSALGSSEPGYFLLVKIFSGSVQKDLLMSFLNGALIYSLVTWLIRNKVSCIAITLLSLNFYLMVLFFGAERLKLAILFLMFAINFGGVRKPIMASLAFISHTQTIFLIVNWISFKFLPILKLLLIGRLKRKSWKVIFLLIAFVVLMMSMMGHMLSKLEAYSSRTGGLEELIKPFLFLFLTLLYAKKDRLNAFVMHLPILIGAFLLGGERLVIFSYFIFLYYALRHKKGLNIGIFLTSIYFSYKGILFINNILSHANGFYGANSIG